MRHDCLCCTTLKQRLVGPVIKHPGCKQKYATLKLCQGMWRNNFNSTAVYEERMRLTSGRKAVRVQERVFAEISIIKRDQ